MPERPSCGSPTSPLVSAFPADLADDVQSVITRLALPASQPASSFSVRVGEETVMVPGRIYNAEMLLDDTRDLTAIQRLILDCLYTRHHDGFVRQRHLEHIVRSTLPWVVPFVVKLVGEYVLEILLAIRRELVAVDVPGTAQQRVYGAFIADNPEFFAVTRQRATSYWNCYYRNMYASLANYPGHTILTSLQDAARRRAART